MLDTESSPTTVTICGTGNCNLYTLIVMREGFVEPSGKIEDMDRDIDLKFWQSQSDTQRFSAAWELVCRHLSLKTAMSANSDFEEPLSILNDNDVNGDTMSVAGGLIGKTLYLSCESQRSH